MPMLSALPEASAPPRPPIALTQKAAPVLSELLNSNTNALASLLVLPRRLIGKCGSPLNKPSDNPLVPVVCTKKHLGRMLFRADLSPSSTSTTRK